MSAFSCWSHTQPRSETQSPAFRKVLILESWVDEELFHMLPFYQKKKLAIIKLDRVLKSRVHHFADKSLCSQRYGFSSSNVWMWELDHKNVEHQRTYVLELWCLRRLLRVPWTARRSNQLILKEINPESSLEGLMLKLKLQYFGHLTLRADSLEKTLMLGKHWRQKEKWAAEDEIVR